MKPMGPTGLVWRRGNRSLILHPRRWLVGSLLLAATLAMAMLSLGMGRIELSGQQILDIFMGLERGSLGERVVMDIRLPRVLTAIFVGAALGASGAVFQSISRNALGSPDVIGFTTGAASGAIVQIVLFGQGTLAVALSAMGGGLLCALLVYLLALKDGVVGGYRLVLVGIGVGAILSAFNGLMLVKGNLDNAIMANLWLSGSLNARNWSHVLPVMIGTVLLVPSLMLSVRNLSLLEMGDELARQLGVAVERTRLLAMVQAVLLAALATGAAGPIAFVALAAPQLAARLGATAQLSIFCSAAMGACLLVAADLFIQSLPVHLALPIGRMTGVLGGLYLLWLLGRSKRM